MSRSSWTATAAGPARAACRGRPDTAPASRSCAGSSRNAPQRKVRYLTLFAFSSENWRRPPDEVGMLMKLVPRCAGARSGGSARNQVRLRFIGDRDVARAPSSRAACRTPKRSPRAIPGWGSSVAVAYGGRWDIAQACRSLAADVAAGKLRRGGHRRDADRGAARARRHPGSRSADPHRRRAAHQQFPAVESRLHRAVFHRRAVAGIFAGAICDAAFEFFAQRERRFGKTSAQVARESRCLGCGSSPACILGCVLLAGTVLAAAALGGAGIRRSCSPSAPGSGPAFGALAHAAGARSAYAAAIALLLLLSWRWTDEPAHLMHAAGRWRARGG